ncbi:MAG: L-rhamnose isomerase, partial [Bacteroidales bacterium]|nr:L-rhamnose isomerase [Bacteroidales bacterium]
MSNYYHLARDQYLELGIDTDQVLDTMNRVVISLHCWQGDDIRGFEPRQNSVGGGLQITGNYPGRARNIEELQQDLEYVMQLLPGRQKVSLHAIYGDYKGASIDRDQIRPEHFQYWIDWAKQLKTGLDFNATCFAHPNASSGRTLAHKDQKIREFWINHVKACRGVAAEMGHQLGEVCVHNLWIPDASKDTPADRMSDRQLLIDSLDRIYEIHYSEDRMLDSVESKLFGIGGESMTVGSHEFYLGYALKNNLMVCLDNGHFHPTEQVADKISALIPFVKGLLLHLTRGVRWDSDHVATFNDEICAITQEVV